MKEPAALRVVGWIAGLGVALAGGTGLARGEGEGRPGGFTPTEAVSRMTLREGFHAEVFASEPDIRQPVAACFDERGRMWVIEYLQYPSPNGLKAVTVDQYLRTEYDRVPEPPPHGPRGADRVKILEDTDDDGRADKVTTFVEGLNLASGLAVGRGGLFVVQAPYLLFYPDKDRDDRPDGDPEVLLKGFGLQDAHAVANSLTWGPDGWLYGAQGSTVTARIAGYEFQQGIWRYHPETRKFELFAEGGGNTWGLDFDRLGRILGSSNGSFVAFHMVQGGYYWKGFAKHGPLHNPRTYGYFDSLKYEGRKRGGHVTPGGIIYKGDAYPARFWNTFVGGNLLSNAVYWHELEERGSTLAARHGGELIEARDRWFRPVDLLTGPDGCIYVVDWYDRRASHLDPRDNWDKTNGRIYRVVSGRRKAIGQFDMSTWSTEDLVSMVDQENDWWPDLARRVLWERRDTAAAPGLWARLAGERDEALAMRLVWALDACGGLDRAQAIRLFDHPVAGVRAWAVRRVGDRDFEWWDDALGQRLARLAVEDESAHVRSQLASSCQRWGFSRARAVIGGLTRRDEDMDDPFIPLQIWWAIERAFSDGVEGEGRALVEMLRQTDVSGRPLVRAHLLERAARALASEERAGSLELVLALVEGCPNPEAAEAAMRGVDLGLTGRVVGPLPAAERERWARLWSNGGEPSDAMVRVAVRLGDDAMYERAIERASRASEPEADRLALVELLGQVRRPDGRKALVTILETEPNGALRQAVISALGAYAEGVVYERMLAVYPSLDSAGRERVRGLLSSRREAAARLLEALEGGSIDPKELGLAQVQQLVALGDGALKARLENVWGRVPGTNSEERRQRIAEVRGVLPEGDKGSAARGREVFQKACAGCHRMFGEGGAIGPDLSGAERGDLDFLLTSLVDPSALIRGEYEGRTVALKDGRVLTGLVVEENGASLTLVDSQQQKTTIGRGEVEEMGAAPLSIMPDGLLDTMKDEEIRDLFRFLQSENPGGR